MEKSKILGFINKYSLGGSVESVELILTPESMSTRFMTNQQDVIGELKLIMENKNITTETAVGIANTNLLLKMMSVLDEDIELQVIDNPSTNTPISIKIGDKSTTVNYMVADNSIIQKVPVAKKLPDFDYEFDFTRESFSDKFVKATSAFSDVDTFKITPFDSGIYFNLGTNENKLQMKILNIVGKCTRPICFNSKLLKEIFLANKDASGGRFSVIEGGICKIELTVQDYNVTYYLVEIVQYN